MDENIYGNGPYLGSAFQFRKPKGKGDTSPNPAPVPGAGTPLRLNPKTLDFVYAGASIPPHALTQRWIYQVPPRRRAKIDSGVVEVIRVTAAPGNLRYAAQIQIQRNGSSDWIPIAVCASCFGVSIVSGGFRQNMSSAVELFEGDQMRAVTEDTNGGGTVNYCATATGTEFDAVQTGG